MRRRVFVLARKNDLLVRELGDELLVYDLLRDKAHCLSPLASKVWRQCNGKQSAQMIAANLKGLSEKPHREEVVAAALDQLRQADLLIDSDAPNMARRMVLRKVGTAAAAISIPFVISVVAPEAAQAITLCLPSGAPCVSSSQCCGGFCLGNHTCR